MKGDEMAFPSANDCVEGGLTKREYIAAMAMQGLCSQGQAIDPIDLAEATVNIADALIKELSK